MMQMKQGDRRPAYPATIKRGATVVPLTDATSVAFKATERTEMQLTVNSAATILVAASGTVEYRWADGDTDQPGVYDVEWEVTWSDGTKETFPTLGYDTLIIHGDLDGRAS